MLKLGIIGLGVGVSHLKGVLRISNATVKAICDTDPQKLKKVAEQYGIRESSSDYRTMLADPEIDGVCVATPDHLHLQMVCDALRAGKHVLCEKPLSLHSDECKEMIRVAEETGKLLMVGQVCRMSPGFIAAKKLIDDGTLGEVYFIESEYAHDYSAINGWRKEPALQRHPVTGGGCHPVDLVRWLTGSDPCEVFSYSTHRALPDWPCDDSTIAVLKFHSGLAGKIYVSTGCKRNYTMRTVIYGTKGTVIVDNTTPHLSLFTECFGGLDAFSGKKMKEIEHRIPVRVDNHNFGDEIAEFCSCIESGLPPKISAEEGRKAVAVCEAIIRSSATGLPEQVLY